jgi:hypothetical protein
MEHEVRFYLGEMILAIEFLHNKGTLTLLLMPLAGLHFCVELDFVTPLVVIFFK